jgi:hypothetical protein
MAATGRKFITGLRAVFALVLLLFNSLAPAVKLTLPEPDACGMACCLESGVCYCHSGPDSRSGREGRGHSGGEESPDEFGDSRPAEMAAATITSSCPAQCAKLPAGFQKKTSLARARIPGCASLTNIARLLYACAQRIARNALRDASSAPRAPPGHSPAE